MKPLSADEVAEVAEVAEVVTKYATPRSPAARQLATAP